MEASGTKRAPSTSRWRRGRGDGGGVATGAGDDAGWSCIESGGEHRAAVPSPTRPNESPPPRHRISKAPGFARKYERAFSSPPASSIPNCCEDLDACATRHPGRPPRERSLHGRRPPVQLLLHLVQMGTSHPRLILQKCSSFTGHQLHRTGPLVSCYPLLSRRSRSLLRPVNSSQTFVVHAFPMSILCNHSHMTRPERISTLVLTLQYKTHVHVHT
jgi:hypothetical protein